MANNIVRAKSSEDATDQFARQYGGIVGRCSDGSMKFRDIEGWFVVEYVEGGGLAEAIGLPTIIMPSLYRLKKA